jgi:2-hydroxychromene-2-carboxylate isomerase
MTTEITHYFDYKSPYAYLAQAATEALEEKYEIRITRIPYTLNIPDFLGAAELSDTGADIIGTRSAHQWRRVRYSYMDCRREANRRGLTIRGPKKIWNSSLAHIGFLYASEHGQFAHYHAIVYERFWQRALDIEDIAVIIATLSEAGIDPATFSHYARGPGRARLEALHQRAEAAGVFGVPSWTVNGELFWGSERLGLIDEALARLVASSSLSRS